MAKKKKKKGYKSTPNSQTVMRKAHIHNNEDLKRYSRRRDKKGEEE